MRLVFGSRSSPKLFDTLSTAVCWIAKNNYSIDNILHLLDDFLVIEPTCVNAKVTMARFLSVFGNLNIPLGAHKTVGPVFVLEYLGIYLDSVLMQARLPSEKIDRIKSIIDSFASRKSCTKRELLSLLGHMNFASRVVRPGRSFVSHLLSLASSVHELYYHVKLSEACRSDLSMWSTFLSSWNGVSFFLNDDITLAADMHLFTDATPLSFGGFFQNQWFQGYFPPELASDGTSMALCELYPIVMACILWGHTWSRKRILFHCDNLGTAEIITKGRSKIKTIMTLMRKLTYHSAMNNYVIHIAGVHNNIADALSRFQMQKFRALAPHAALLPVPCLTLRHLTMN